MNLAEVALNVPLYQTFHYLIPEELQDKDICLRRVLVPFGARQEVGFVLRVVSEEHIKEQLAGFTLKTLEELIDQDPIFTPQLLQLAEKATHYYFAPIGEMIFAMLPPLVKKLQVYDNPHKNRSTTFTPSEAQEEAFQQIAPLVGKKDTVLLQGVTGSGKTEVYKMLVRECLRQNRSAIVMVPEIGLTDQTLRRFTEEFGEQVALFHSRLKPQERAYEWQRALKGEATLVIGPRSAVFAPLENLGLIIIDEEHDHSYKAGNSPRYHARGTAFLRSAAENALLVLGSATPSLESRHAAEQGIIAHVRLLNRYGEVPLPQVDIVDLTKEKSGNHIISAPLLQKMIAGLADGKQSLIFLNRRGYAPVLLCKDCGFFFKCPNCEVGMTYHKSENSVRCRYCGFEDPAPHTCPECGGFEIKEIGFGTEKIEENISELLPKARILRLDLDTARKKMGTENILRAMHAGEADILVGTQMIAKGHDLANVQLVGALFPDLMLSLPDFRASERTFSLLAQAVGRAGRRDSQGQAIIQTYLPEHPSVLTAISQDYENFYKGELPIREAFGYPPFQRMGRVVFRALDKGILIGFIKGLKLVLNKYKDHRKEAGLELLGPSPCPIEKLNNQFRYHIILKAATHALILREIKALKRYYDTQKIREKIKIEIDIDPSQVL